MNGQLTSKERIDQILGHLNQCADSEFRYFEISPETSRELRSYILSLQSTHEPGADAEDAAKWRALRNCARITAMGSAGVEPGGDSYNGPTAHVTLNFWTHNERETQDYPRRWLDKFVEKALRATSTKGANHA